MLAYSAIIKVVFPSIIAGSLVGDYEAEYGTYDSSLVRSALKAPMKMISKMRAKATRREGVEVVERADDSDDEDDDYDEDDKPDYNYLTWAWLSVAEDMSVGWSWFIILFGIYQWRGSLDQSIVFYIEHLISNFGWILYMNSVGSLFGAALEQNDILSWVSFLGFGGFAYWAWSVEYALGTDAIRYLKPDYYSDPTLLPSLLYIFGVREHQITTTSEYEVDTHDTSQEDDIVIDQFLSVTY